MDGTAPGDGEDEHRCPAPRQREHLVPSVPVREGQETDGRRKDSTTSAAQNITGGEPGIPQQSDMSQSAERRVSIAEPRTSHRGEERRTERRRRDYTPTYMFYAVVLLLCVAIILFLIAIIIRFSAGWLFREPRALSTLPVPRDRSPEPVRVCGYPQAKVVLTYTLGQRTGFRFDLCSVIDCGPNPSDWTSSAVYLCMDYTVNGRCAAFGAWYGMEPWCPRWDQVVGYTGSNWQPDISARHRPALANYRVFQKGNFSFIRQIRGPASAEGQNPLLLSLNWHQLPRERPQNRTFFLVVGVDQTGTDTKSLIQINVQLPPDRPITRKGTPTAELQEEVVVKQIDYSHLCSTDVIAITTGYAGVNLWLEWLAAEAREHMNGSCVACAAARPNLHTEPGPVHPEDKEGYSCLLGLTRGSEPINCQKLAAVYPPISNETRPPAFTPVRGPPNAYPCFNFSTTKGPLTYDYGEISPDWCNHSLELSTSEVGSWARAGLFWFCGTGLHVRLRLDAKGVCALVRLITPVSLIGTRLQQQVVEPDIPEWAKRPPRHIRTRRNNHFDHWDLTRSSVTYIDAIGVPRGVPDEYKLSDQVGAGFENLPIIAALFPITPNKNVDRLNYVHYNVQRLANLTRDAVDGLASQLSATSLMAVQNRIALDMLLAEKGVVCSMFGDVCCTFIPNNTAPDGSVTRALEGLRTLSNEMTEQSGVSSLLGGWWTRILGKWKGVMFAMLSAITIFCSITIVCGCCCVPCIRALCVRFITSTVEKGAGQSPGAMMPLLPPDLPADDFGNVVNECFM